MTDILSRYNGVSLAYLGDAVIELHIRARLLAFGITDTGRLSMASQKLVCAGTQSVILDAVLPELTEEEMTAYKRGRNHRAASKPKHATVAEYSRATGLEALFGYLWLLGAEKRIEALFSLAYDAQIEALRGQI